MNFRFHWPCARFRYLPQKLSSACSLFLSPPSPLIYLLIILLFIHVEML